MNSADLKLLERIFEDDIASAIGERHDLPTQIRGKRIEALAAQGLVEKVKVTLPGRFPVVVEGWRLTPLGHMTYCMSC